MSNIERCDPDIFEHGKSVFMWAGSVTTELMEDWVRSIAQKSKQPVDWHRAGGAAVVLTTGRVGKVERVIQRKKMRKAFESAVAETRRMRFPELGEADTQGIVRGGIVSARKGRGRILPNLF